MKRLLLAALLTIALNANAKFSHQSELSTIQTGGNTNLQTYNFNTINKEKIGVYAATLSGHYTLGSSEVDDGTGNKEKKESARNWDVLLRFDRDLSKKLDVFTSVQYQGDEFSGYKQRENYDLGAKYNLVTSDDLNTFFELGYRYTTERRTTRNEENKDVLHFNKARVYYEINQKLNPVVSYRFWTEYIPNFTDADDYQISAEPSLSMSMSEVFSLKVAYKGIYDNVPNKEGNEYLDWTYTTSILAKF